MLHGDGKRREALMERARGVENVVFSEPIPDKTSVARLAAASDACMTIYKDVPILATCSPNKLFDTFAAGRPAVVNCDGWMRSLVEDNDAGVFARPGDPADLAAQVQSLRGRTEEMGRNARALAEREFDRDLLAGRMLEVLERVAAVGVKLSYCIVNTNGADYLPACLESRATPAPRARCWCSTTPPTTAPGELGRPSGSTAARARPPTTPGCCARPRASTRCCSTRTPSCTPAPRRRSCGALDEDPGAAAVGAQLVSSEGEPVPCAWRLPAWGPRWRWPPGTQKLLVTQSGGTRRREVGWCQSSALLVRRSAAEQVGFLDPDFFVYSDETDFCKRLRDAGWRILFEPAAVATHHNQLSNDRAAEARRLAEFHRNRDLYMRKHHSTAERLLTRALWVVAYLERALLGSQRPHAAPRPPRAGGRHGDGSRGRRGAHREGCRRDEGRTARSVAGAG